jgi:ABC-type sugar transport system substrate-binding protein
MNVLKQVLACLLLASCLPMAGRMMAGEGYSKDRQYVIGWSNCFAVPFGSAADNYISAQFKKYPNVTLHMTNARGEAAKQVADIEDLLLKGCQAIIVFAIDASTLYNVLQQAANEGIKIINVQRQQQRLAGRFIGPDFSNVGQVLAEYFLKKFGDKPFKYCWLLGETGNVTNIENKAGWDAAIAATGRTDIIQLDAKNSRSSRADSKTIVENWLTAYGEDINVILSGNDEMAMGAIMALKEVNLDKKILVSGVNATAEILPYVKDGTVAITFTLATGAFPAVEMALDIVSGNDGKYKQTYKIPVTPVTIENLEQYYDKVIHSGLYMLGELQPDDNPIFMNLKDEYPELEALKAMIPK